MKYISIALLSILAIVSCSKGGSGEGTPPLSNLTLVADVSTDSSGNVTFTAKADNATTYEFDFGNGNFQIVPSGVVTYKYPASGNYSVRVTAKNAAGNTLSKGISVLVAIKVALIFSDEFDVAGQPDASKWGYDIGTGSNGWGNNESQYYTNRPENVTVSNGTVKLTAKKENFSGSSYTSARMLTQNKFSFKYGKVEVRAKLPAGVGTWPAIWMLGSNISTVGWPACGEIDIMEHLGRDLNKVFAALHHPNHSGGNADGGNTVIQNTTTEFHIYSCEWTASSIKFFVDGVNFYTFPNSPAVPFNHNFFIILNIAMGGNFGGAIDPAFNSGTMEIDYVRVYQ